MLALIGHDGLMSAVDVFLADFDLEELADTFHLLASNGTHPPPPLNHSSSFPFYITLLSPLLPCAKLSPHHHLSRSLNLFDTLVIRLNNCRPSVELRILG